MLPQFAMQQQLYRRVHSRRPFTGVRNREAGCTRVAPRPATAVQQASPIAAAEQLQRWLSKTTATGKVSIAPDAGGLPRLVASKDLQAGEAVLSVPDSAWLSTQAVKKHPLGAALDGLEPWLQLALILVSERFGSSSSPQGSAWAAYVAALPQPAISPLMWTEQELALVQGTQLLQSLQSYNAFFAAKFEELKQQRFDSNPSAFPAAVFTSANFLWAVASVRSRIHAPLDGDKLALVPLADMVAHSRNANVAWRPRSSGLFGRDQALAVEATRPVKQGEALQMDFGLGKLDNEVLLDYGVLDAANAKSGYSLALTLPPSDRNLDDKLDILELSGLAGTSSFTLTADRQPEEDMLAFLRLMSLQGSDTFLLEPVFRNDVWGHMQMPISQENEQALCTSMIQGAREALSVYASTIQEDLALLRSGTVSPGSTQEKALLVRLGEKEALESVLRFFEQREALLPTLEYYQERRLKRLGLLDDKGNTTYDGFFEKGIA